MKAEIFRFSPHVSGLPSNNIVSIYPAKGGLVWLGAFKAGLAKLDTRPRKFRRFRVDQSGPNQSQNVTTLSEDQLGNRWLGTQFGLIRRDKETTTHFQAEPANSSALTTNNITTPNKAAAIGVSLG